MSSKNNPNVLSHEERQAMLKEANAIQERLRIMSEGLDTLASAVFDVSIKKLDSLEEDLNALKIYAATATNEAELEEKINAMNKRVEDLAKTVIIERAEDAKRFRQSLSELIALIDKLVPLIDAYEVPDSDKAAVKDVLIGNRNAAQKEIDEATDFINALSQQINNVQIEERLVITKDGIDSRIDEILKWLQHSREFLFPKQTKGTQQ